MRGLRNSEGIEGVRQPERYSDRRYQTMAATKINHKRGEANQQGVPQITSNAIFRKTGNLGLLSRNFDTYGHVLSRGSYAVGLSRHGYRPILDVAFGRKN